MTAQVDPDLEAMLRSEGYRGVCMKGDMVCAIFPFIYTEKTVFEKAIRSAISEGATKAAALVLEHDELFRSKVLDMAGLSDSDHIHVHIELKPAGQ